MYTLYKTTNTVNGMIYIGVHCERCWPKSDGYLGSGTYFTNTLRKYGSSAFKREILMLSDSHRFITNLERLYVTAEFCKLDTNYNLVVGGRYTGRTRGPITDETRQRMSESAKSRAPVSAKTLQCLSKSLKGKNKGRKFSEEAKQKMRENRKTTVRKPHSEETKKKMRAAARKRINHPLSEEHKRKLSEIGKGRRHSEETKKLMSEIAYKRYA